MAIVSNGKTTPQSLPSTPQGQPLAAIYARVSTQEQADKGYSLPTQIDACLETAQQHGYRVPESHIFRDDYTGTSLNRPHLAKLRDLVRQRLVHAVIVYDLDRLSRKLAHQLLLTEEFEQAAVVLHIVSMPHGARTPETQLFDHMRGVFAEYERAKIEERTTRGRKGRALAGHVPGGTVPLGYVAQGDTYSIVPDEASLVKRIFALYLDGMSQEAIATLLTMEGTTPPGDRRPGPGRRLAMAVWHQGTVHDILHNTTYMGTLYYGKRQRLPGKKNPERKTRWRAVEPASQIAIRVPAIIDADKFQAVLARAQHNRIHSKRNRQYEYLFISGRLRCGQCGSAMSGHPNPNGGSARYRCTRRAETAVFFPHTTRGIVARKIEPVVWEAIERALNNPDLIATEMERRREDTSTQQSGVDSERQQYTRQLAQCDKDLKRWEVAYLGEAIDLADFKAKKAEIDTHRASVTQELAHVDDRQRHIEQYELETVSLIEYCARVRSGLQHFTMEEKRRALEALGITITWNPHHDPPITVDAKIPVVIGANASQRMDSSKTSPPTGS